MVRLERDEDFAVGVADGAVVDVGHDGERLRQPHVVEDHGPFAVGHDLADGVLDLAEDALGLLDPRAGGGADVQPELARVHRGEEVLAENGEQGQRTQGEGRASPPPTATAGSAVAPAAARRPTAAARTPRLKASWMRNGAGQPHGRRRWRARRSVLRCPAPCLPLGCRA